MTPLVTAITRASFHDGPGIRTVVYLKGCPLSCRWCHNPENLLPMAEVLYYPQKCMGCGRCMAACPEHHRAGEEGHVYIPPEKACPACQESARQCPAGALQLCGEVMTAEALFAQIAKDASYYERSGGGVTFSGGECLLYPDYLSEVLAACKKASIHTAIESSFCLPWENIEGLLPLVDTFLVDIKHMDEGIHRRYTGRGNGKILENIRALSMVHRDIWIRIPVIPGVNDSQANLAQTAAFIKLLGEGISQVELLPYNPMAEGKYRAANRPYESFGQTQSEEILAQMYYWMK